MNRTLALMLLATGCAADSEVVAPVHAFPKHETAPTDIPTEISTLYEQEVDCPAQVTRVQQSVCMSDARPQVSSEPCELYAVDVNVTLCEGVARHVLFSGEVGGNNGTRELFFDASGRLRLLVDEAHGSQWISEAYSYERQGEFCTLMDMVEWDEDEGEATPPDRPLIDRLRAMQPCDQKLSWPTTPYSDWPEPRKGENWMVEDVIGAVTIMKLALPRLR